MKEKRKHSRQQADDYFIVLEKRTDDILGRIQNMTVTGMMLVSENDIEESKSFDCRMALPEVVLGRDQVFFTAECRWCHKNETYGWYEVGFEFKGVSEKDSAVIDQLLRRWEVADPIRSIPLE